LRVILNARNLLPNIGKVKRKSELPSKPRNRKPLAKNDPWTAAVVGRIEQALGLLGYEKRDVPDWGELAKAAGMGDNRLSECRNGTRRLQIGEVAGIAARLKVRAGWLAFEELPMREEKGTELPRGSSRGKLDEGKNNNHHGKKAG
jgi:hypothetical protein